MDGAIPRRRSDSPPRSPARLRTAPTPWQSLRTILPEQDDSVLEVALDAQPVLPADRGEVGGARKIAQDLALLRILFEDSRRPNILRSVEHRAGRHPARLQLRYVTHRPPFPRGCPNALQPNHLWRPRSHAPNRPHLHTARGRPKAESSHSRSNATPRPGPQRIAPDPQPRRPPAPAVPRTGPGRGKTSGRVRAPRLGRSCGRRASR